VRAAHGPEPGCGPVAPSSGQGGSRLPPCQSRTVRETFASHGSSSQRALSWLPLGVRLVMTVAVHQDEVG
jgi:hypothetical protein